ncbi:MAG: MBL fold metallo-hydrolase, partial [Clostridia bacterium]|nr:MBL fold metallo-hydrolase [Clostridia bacterium]
MTIHDDIINVGISDKNTVLFEGQYKVGGMAYNSYLIKDEKCAVLDTVDFKFGEQWINNIKATGTNPDYLIITHVEPDHSSNISRFMREFPNAEIVANAKAFNMIKNFFGEEFAGRKIEVKDGETFSLGVREITFIAAPMVHWPE